MFLSAVVLTKNNALIIKRCLENLSFCDEIIIIDDFSEDQTCEIAEKQKAKVYRRHLKDDFSSQRNYALSKTKGDWILFVDSDEVVTKELKEEILKTVKENNPLLNGYYLKRRDVFMEKLLRFGETGNIKILRIARKNKGKWKRKVHEVWEIEGEKKVLKNYLFHYPHTSLKLFVKSINYFSFLHALEISNEGKRSSIIRIIVWPIGKFFVNFVLKGGFLDGVYGFIYAMFISFHSFLSWSSLWLKQREK